MILRNLELEQFGKFRGQSFEFRRGMNLVVGPNEAGKSTLAEAIPAILFGTSRAEKFKPWGRGGCVASLVLEGEGRTVEIRRNMLSDEVQIVERDDLYHTLVEFKGVVPARGRTADSERYFELLTERLGIAEEDLFRATYFYGQTLREWTGDLLAEKLRRLVSGPAETDYAAVLDGLLEEHFQLTRENPWGRNKQRDRELELLQKKIAACPAEEPESGPQETSAQAAAGRASLEAQIAALKTEIAEDRSEYDKGVRYVERLRESHLCDNEQTDAEPETLEAVEVPEARSSLQQRLAAAGLPENLPPDLPEILKEAADIRQELARFHQPLAALTQKRKNIPSVPWVALVSLTLLLAAGAAACWWFSFFPLPAVVIAVISGLLLLGWGGFRHDRGKRAQEEIDEEEGRLELQRETVLIRQNDLSDRCEALGLPTSAIDMVRLQKIVAQNQDLIEESRQDEAPAPTVDVTVKAGGQPPESAESDELKELGQRLADFEAALNAKEEQLQTFEQQLKEMDEMPSSVPRESERLALLQSQQKMEGRIAILRTAVDLLVEAVDNYSRTHSVALCEEAGRLFGKMTAGKYRQIRLDDDMQPEVMVAENSWQLADRFSRGTIDALYLALRVSLAKVRSDGLKMPMLLDDPFVHLDRTRQKAAMNLVDLAAADGQLILLSHNEDLARRAAKERWHVVPLGEENDGSAGEEEQEHAGQLHLL